MKIKSYIADLLSQIPPVNKFFSGIVTIFMLHRVSPIDKRKLKANENMKISPEFLEELIKKLIEKGVEFISLDRLCDILHNHQKVDSYKVIFTLDDGYKDNFYTAYPIFRKYDIPFTIYITPSFPDKKSPLWWYILEDIILKNDEIELSDGTVYETKTKEQKEKAFLEIRKRILSNLSSNYMEVLNNIFKKYEIDWFSKNEELCMSWDEIIEISKDELCSIGNHTLNHLPLTNLDIYTLRKEIEEANRILESKLGRKIKHFAYPFGSRDVVKRRELDFIKRFNFKTAVTASWGTVYYEHKYFLNCCLPRIMVTEEFSINKIGRLRRRKIVIG